MSAKGIDIQNTRIEQKVSEMRALTRQPSSAFGHQSSLKVEEVCAGIPTLFSRHTGKSCRPLWLGARRRTGCTCRKEAPVQLRSSRKSLGNPHRRARGTCRSFFGAKWEEWYGQETRTRFVIRGNLSERFGRKRVGGKACQKGTF
jgi:hypothetical protein